MIRSKAPLPTIERLREVLYLDDSSVLRWRVQRGRMRPGDLAFTAVNLQGHHVGSVDFKIMTRGRVVFALTHGRFPIGEVRRLDGISANDHPENLVDVQTDPRGPRRPHSVGVSEYVGIYPSGNSWVARRCVGGPGTSTYIGSYATQEEAARAYDAAAPSGSDWGGVRNFPEAQA